jgi:hypothetical protein
MVPQHTSPQAHGITPATLAAVLARGIAAHPELAVKMAKAAHLIEQGAITVEAYGWSVHSECTPDVAYTVTPDGACSCPDCVQRGGPCKHFIATQLLAACEAGVFDGAEDLHPLARPGINTFCLAKGDMHHHCPGHCGGPYYPACTCECHARKAPHERHVAPRLAAAPIPYVLTAAGRAYLDGARDGYNGAPIRAGGAYLTGYLDAVHARLEALGAPGGDAA